MINKYFILIASVFILSLSGCSLFGGRPGGYVADALKPGMNKEEALSVLSRGATFIEEKSLHVRGSESWNQLLELKPLRETLRDSEERTGMKAQTCSEVSRMWGFMGYDVFYLFLSEEDVLLGYTQWHFN
jgi:hypothetical protein